VRKTFTERKGGGKKREDPGEGEKKVGWVQDPRRWNHGASRGAGGSCEGGGLRNGRDEKERGGGSGALGTLQDQGKRKSWG